MTGEPIHALGPIRITPIEPPMCVWVSTEGLPISPILCAAADLCTTLAEALQGARIAGEVALVPCCRTGPETAMCPRDYMADPGELDAPTELLMRAALALDIVWPADVGQLEPEYSVLPDQ